MDVRQQRFDRSSSMADIHEPYTPLQKIESLRWDQALESSQRALHQSMNSPAYHQFRNNTAPVWNTKDQGLHSLIEETMGAEGSFSNVQSPSSDTTVKLGNDYKDRSGGYARSSAPNIAITTPETSYAQDTRNSRSENPLSLHSHPLAEILANSTHQPRFGNLHQTQDKHAMYALPPGWTPPAQIQNERPQEPTCFAPNASSVTFDDAGPRPSTFGSSLGSHKDRNVPHRMNLHQRRLSGKISSLPIIPSPLGPGRTKEQLHRGDDGGMSLSPVPNGANLLVDKLEYRRQQENNEQMRREDQKAAGPESPTVRRYASMGSISSPAFDVYPRIAQIDDDGNIFLPPPGPANGSGHTRKHTDPFVDHDSTQRSSPFDNPRMSGPFTPFQLPSQSSIRPPRTPFTAPWLTSAPAAFGFAGQPTSSFSHAASGPVPQRRLPERSNLPIPPPPLSSIHGQYQNTPEARAHLEAQKPARADWIRTEAADIAKLARLRHGAERRYQEMRSEQDYENWQKIERAYYDATNLEKRQEERRNLFLNEKGMAALKTDKLEDMSAASRDQRASGGEEKLLGFKMALMERECAEIKRDGGEEAITVEMLATLSLEEKKALRKHLVGRLEKS